VSSSRVTDAKTADDIATSRPLDGRRLPAFTDKRIKARRSSAFVHKDAETATQGS